MVAELVLLAELPASPPCRKVMLVYCDGFSALCSDAVTYTLLGEREQSNDEDIQAGCVEDEHPDGGGEGGGVRGGVLYEVIQG